MSTDTKHDNRGRLVLHTRRGPDGPTIIYDMAKCDARLFTEERDDVEYREVLPNSIEITREELRAAIERAKRWGGDGTYEYIDGSALIDELFPEGTHDET